MNIAIDLRARLEAALASNGVIASLGLPIAELAADSQTVHVQAGEVLYRHGETADAAYVVLDGVVEILGTGPGNTTTIVERVEAGALFGERRSLGGTTLPRDKTARAASEANLVRIAIHQAERPILAPTTSEIGKQKDILSDQFPDGGFGNVSHTRRSYSAGEVVFRQGEQADEVFIIETGVAQIFKEDNGQQLLIAQAEAGGFFGERGVMRGEPRAATVIARDALQVLVLDGAGFREQVGHSSKAQAFLSALECVYQMPLRGLIVQGQCVLDGVPAVTSSYSLTDGRNVLVARATAGGAVIFRQSPMPEDVTWLTSDPAPGVRLGVCNEKLVAIEAAQDWRGLEVAAAMMLDAEPLDATRRALFSGIGELQTHQTPATSTGVENICGCMGVSRQDLEAHITNESTVASLTKSTGASSVCGSCRPRLIELLGGEGMIPAQITSRRSLTPEIDSFRIVGLDKDLPKALPGQHLVIDGMIDGNRVRRSYTIVGHEGGAQGLEIAVRREEKGVFSRWLFSSDHTTALRAAEPAGSLHFGDDSRPIVCIVGGIGVTPAVALARAIGAGQLARRPLTIVHSVRTRQDAAFGDEFEQLAGRGELDYRLWVTREAGRLTDEDIVGIVGQHPDARFLLCGPLAFERTVSKQLASAGVPDRDIIVESFAAGGVQVLHVRPELPPVATTDRKILTVSLDRPAGAEEEARRLIEQIYIENNWPEDAMAERLATISPGNDFQPTERELAYAAKLAWRNANKCIGRLYWTGLIVRDRRDVRLAAEVLDQMVEHLDLATNGGRLRSCITVLGELGADSATVISPQLVRYAGHKQPDGSIVGDSSNVELTDIAMSCGWKGLGTPFDVLPLVVRDGAGAYHIRDLEPERALEVPLSHPQFNWFSELGLRWHALPAVTNNYLDAFGKIYPVLFNGFYMGTEIGARNFCDPHRYNILPRVAQKMGLDTSSEGTLWRDRAMIEVNVAVLHSFRQAGVTILDHHRASKELFEFIDQEHAAGRPANVEWTWVVPPISGSSTPQFHVSFPNEQLKPCLIETAILEARVQATAPHHNAGAT